MPELRLIDPHGYDVPGATRTVTADQVEAATANLLTEVATQDADYWAQYGHPHTARQYRVRVVPDPLPTTPGPLADLLLTPGTDPNQVSRQLAAQEGDTRARRLLAAAHGIAADRLFTEAA